MHGVMHKTGIYQHGVSGEMSYEIQTEREKLLALLAKYRDLERRSVS